MAPIRQTGDGRSKRADDPNADGGIGTPPKGAMPADFLTGIKHRCGGPGPEGNIGQDGVERMPQPNAMQRVCHSLSTRASGGDPIVKRGL